MDTTEATQLFETLMFGGSGGSQLASPDGLKEKLLEQITNGTVGNSKIPNPVNTGLEGRRWRRFADLFDLDSDEYQGICDWLEEEYPDTVQKFCEKPHVVTLSGVQLPTENSAPALSAPSNIDMTAISGHALNDLDNCARIQGMSTGDLPALSFLIFTGSLPTGGDSLRPGEDPRMSPAYTRMRKTGMNMLQQYLERESIQLIQMWFRGCQTYAAENGKGQMASSIAMFWSDTEAGFGDDVKLLVLYIEKYLAKYPGRGLPCSRDHKLFMDLKLIDSSNELEGKKSKSSKKSESSDMLEVKEMLEQLKLENKRLERRLDNHGGRNPNGGGERTGDTRECNYCGKKGHLKATCREKKKDEKKKKDDEEAEADGEDE